MFSPRYITAPSITNKKMQTCKLEYTVNSGKRAGGEDAYTPRRNGQTSALKFG